MNALSLLVVAVPFAAAVITWMFGWRPFTAWLGVISSAVIVGGGIALAFRILDSGPIITFYDLIRVDALSAWMIIVIGSVATIANTYAVPYIGSELEDGKTDAASARTYGFLVQIFVSAMVAAVVAHNVGVMWVAVEFTTIATAFLVGHHKDNKALEASWKYIIIGSVGVTMALLGTVLVFLAARNGIDGESASLNWTSLVAVAPQLDPGVMRLAIGLLVLGFGTKVGLAPVHTWLPDAHSQAPAPVSALMSGVLLAVAFYAILRYKVIADAALGTGYLRGLLIAASLLTLLVAASALLAQRDYKRMLALSSIEHMGIIALGTAVGSPLAIGGVLLHMFAHGMGKTVLFCGSGEILHEYGSTRISDVRGMLRAHPFVGGSFGLALLALLGMPPFGLFPSELAIVRAGFAEGAGWAVAIALILIFVIFAALANHGQQMLLGPEPEAGAIRESPSLPIVMPLVLGLITLALLGITSWPYASLLHEAVATVTP